MSCMGTADAGTYRETTRSGTADMGMRLVKWQGKERPAGVVFAVVRVVLDARSD